MGPAKSSSTRRGDKRKDGKEQTTGTLEFGWCRTKEDG